MEDNTLSNLPEKKQKYLKNRAKGMSKRQSALKAGYSESVAKSVNAHIETPDVKQAFREAIEKHAPYEKVARRVAEGLDAIETKFFQKDGFVMESKDVIAWSERRMYAELAAQMGDYWNPKLISQVGMFVLSPPAGSLAALDAWSEDE